MNHLNEKIRRGAKEMLRKNWAKAIAATIVLMATVLLTALVENLLVLLLGLPGLGTVLEYRYNWQGMLRYALPGTGLLLGTGLVYAAVVNPLLLGLARWYLHLTYGGGGDDSRLMFSAFANPGSVLKSIWLYVNIGVRSWLYCGVLFLPGLGMVGMSAFFTAGNPSSMDRIMATMGATMGLCLLLLAAITGGIFSRRYFLAQYIIADDAAVSVEQAIRLSVKATKGYKADIAWFQLSFAGWWLLCVFGLPALYTVPYTMACNALYARSLMDFKGLAKGLSTAPVER